jgi:ribosomal protein L11
MEPTISELGESNNTLTFTLSKSNVSIANALRRIILTNIDAVVLNAATSVDGEQAEGFNISKNTSRFNNEIIKQRLGCIPVHISDMATPVDQYIVELDVINDTQECIIVTTEHLKIKNMKNEKYLTEGDVHKIFPKNHQTQSYIDILRLRPKISTEIPGEEIHMKCPLVIRSAEDNSSYNIVSTCAYGNTPDVDTIAAKWTEYEIDKKKSDETPDSYKNWHIIQSQRHSKKDSFDFIIKSPPASHFIREAAKLKSGSKEPGRVIAGSITMKQAEAIAKEKMKDLNAFDIKEATKIICGSARSMGIEVKE